MAIYRHLLWAMCTAKDQQTPPVMIQPCNVKARNPAWYFHQWYVSLVCGWLPHQFSFGSWNGLWGRYGINYGEIGCNMPEVKPFWWESEMERKPNYKSVIYWKKEMCALPSMLSKEKAANKPERWWQDSKRKISRVSKKIYSYAVCILFPQIFQECASIKRQASINKCLQGPYFFLD